MRRRGSRSLNYQITNYKLQIRSRGYMMITLMLAVALITIGLLAVLPEIKQQVQRDREEELRHRGTAYMRAIQHFYKKFGRYPTRLEELENTNNIRFLRRRYTDPMSRDTKTGKEKDFKLLHQQDISLNNGPVLPGQNGPGGPGGPGGGLLGQGGLQGQSGGQTGGLQQTGGGTSGQSSASGDSGNSSSSGSSNTPGSSNSNTGSSSGFSGPTFGGGPIIGVASTNNKTKTIRVFFDKTHYNDWLFIYVQALDRGGLLVGPVNPNMPPTPNLNGLTPGQPGGGIGQGPGGPGLGGQGLGGQGFGQGLGLTPGTGQTPQPQQNSSPAPPQQ
ncbi:MAG: type II secretion system protein [Terriglobales bacterium]